MREQDYYIPPDVTVNTNGRIDSDDLPSVVRLRNDRSRWVVSFTGMGMPPIRYIEQSGPYQHGATLFDFRLQKRIIQYNIRVTDLCSRQGYWDERGSLINLMRPNRQTIACFNYGRIRKILPDGSIRDIDAMFQQGLTYTARDPESWAEWSIGETLRFVCPDPTWYDPVQQTATWTTATIDGLLFYTATLSDHLIFPDTAIFASSVLGDSITVTYGGTWYAYPTITIVGPLSSPKIENTTLDTKIELDYDVAVGETVTIVTAYGNKSIENNLGDNLIGTKTVDSDLNFYLAPDPIAAGGVNELTVSGAGADTLQTAVSLSYYTRYIGI
jgi:hypothetical protein